MKKALFLAVVSIFLLGALPLSAETVDLLLFNTWSGLGPGGFFTAPALEEPGNRDFRRELLERGIESFEPDLIGLLELNPLPKRALELEERFDMRSVSQISRGGVRVGPVGLPANLRQGMALLADEGWELKDRRVRRLSGGMLGSWYQAGEAGIILSATVRIDGRPVYLFITGWEESLYNDPRDLKLLVDEYAAGDMESGELAELIREAAAAAEMRRLQAEATIDYINQVAGREAVILMGTLADAPDSAVLTMLKSAGFQDTWRGAGGATWDETANPNTALSGGDLYRAGVSGDRVDYVLIRGEGVRSLGSRIVFNQPTYGTWPSDHYGLLVRPEIDAE